MHHEVELGVIISKRGKDIPASSAFDYVAGYCVALDLCVGVCALWLTLEDREEYAGSRQEGGPALDGGQGS